MKNFGKILLWITAISFVIYMIWPAARLAMMLLGSAALGWFWWWGFGHLDDVD